MTIVRTDLGNGKVTYSATSGDVLATESSGETSNFSASGTRWGVFNNTTEEYYVIKGQGNPLLISHNHHPDQQELVVSFHKEREWILSLDRFDPWFYNYLDPTDPNFPEVLSDVAITPITIGAFIRNQETSSTKRYQTLVIQNESTDKWELVVVSDTGIVHQWQFNSGVHQGDATSDRWHEMFFTDDWLFVNLSAIGPPDLPHFRLRWDGTGWEEIQWFDAGGDLIPSGFKHRSHATVDSNRVAAGWFEDGITPVITVNEIEDGSFVNQLENRRWGHGCMRGDLILYSLLGTGDQATVDTGIRLWNYVTDSDIPVASIESGQAGFFDRARPMLSPDGQYAVWHETNTEGNTFVVSQLLTSSTSLTNTYKIPIDYRGFLGEDVIPEVWILRAQGTTWILPRV